MNLLADENVDAVVVQWLVDRGHDVRWIANSCSGLNDKAIIELARKERRILITFDRDFGELVFRHAMRCAGVAFLRLRSGSDAELLARFAHVWPVIEDRVTGHFVVASERGIRVRPM